MSNKAEIESLQKEAGFYRGLLPVFEKYNIDIDAPSSFCPHGELVENHLEIEFDGFLINDFRVMNAESLRGEIEEIEEKIKRL